MRRKTDVLFAVLMELVNDDSGQDLVEYALVFTLLGLAAVASLRGVGRWVAACFTFMSTTLSASI